MTHPKKSKQARTETAQETPVLIDWEDITDIPTDFSAQEKLFDALDMDLKQEFRLRLPQHLRDSFDAPGRQEPELDAEFDKFIVSQSGILGGRLLLCGSVVLRVVKWTLGAEDGTYYLEKFAEGLVRYAKLRLDTPKTKGDISEDLHAAKEGTTHELAALQKEIRKHRADRHRSPGLTDIEKIICAGPAVYLHYT